VRKFSRAEHSRGQFYEIISSLFIAILLAVSSVSAQASPEEIILAEGGENLTERWSIVWPIF
jgi:hypothetical protein